MLFESNFDITHILSNYSNLVYKLALLRLKNKQDTEDVYQEVFLRLVKYRHKIQSEEHLKAWLIRVTINCAKKQQLQFWRTKDMSFPEEPFYQPEDSQELHSIVSKLPKKYSEVLHLFYYEDLPVKQISTILGIKESTVKSQLSRGREKLRDLLEEENYYG